MESPHLTIILDDCPLLIEEDVVGGRKLSAALPLYSASPAGLLVARSAGLEPATFSVRSLTTYVLGRSLVSRTLLI